MAETFNVEAAQKALTNAKTKIQELIENRRAENELVESNFGQNVGAGSALGGAVGAAAQSAYQNGSSIDFSELSKRMDEFINNRVETIVKNSSSMSEQAETFYSSVN